MALPKGSLEAGVTGAPIGSSGAGVTGGSDGAISTSDADPMAGTARSGRNGSPAPVTTSYVAQPTQTPSSSYSSTATYGSSSGGNGSYSANPYGSSSYNAGSRNNATSGSYSNAGNSNLRPSSSGASNLGGQTVRPALVISTARVSIRGSRPLPSGLGVAPQSTMDFSNPAISTSPVTGAPSLVGDGVPGGTIAMRNSAPIEASINGRGVQGSGLAVRSAGLKPRTINAGFVIRGEARAVGATPALNVQGVSGSKTMPGMIVRGNEARAAGQGSSGGIGVRGMEARNGFAGIGSQDRNSNSGAGNSAIGNLDIQARGPQSTPPAAPVMPATEGFPTDSGVRADAPTVTARTTAQTTPQEVQPLESVLPGLFIGQKLEASLTIALVAVEQGVAPLVAVTQNPPCGKDRCSPVVWIGQAQLGPDRRIWVSIDQASYEGRTYSVRGQALGAQDLRPGLQAAVWDEAPTLVSDLVRGALGGFSDYLGAQLGAKTTTLIPGGGVTQTGSVPDLANFFDARLSSLFSIPAESKALVRVARVEPESKFIVLFGIAPQLAARQR